MRIHLMSRLPSRRWLRSLVLAGSFLPWAARRGFFTIWLAGVVAVAALSPAARAGEVTVEGVTHPSAPVRGLLQLAALVVVGLITAQTARAAGRGRIAPALAALALLGAPAFAEGDRAAPKPDVRHFKSGGKEVAVEHIAPQGEGKHPVLVVLHGVDGIEEECVDKYRGAARAAAGRGYLVLLVHYYDRTGSTKKDIATYRELLHGYFARKEHTNDEARKIDKLSAEWVGAVRDAVAYARTLPNADGEHVGLVGFSLGATVALTAATKHDLKVKALVDLFGTLPPSLRSDPLTKLPPTLVIHGEEDKVVPAEQAYILVGLLSLRKVKYEAEVYPGTGHLFSKDGKTTQAWTLLKAQARTNDFLDMYLKPASVAVTAN